MANRRAYNSLSEAYRTRLERGGITRQGYERGDSLSAARGHSGTPEHPSQSSGDRYREYRERHQERESRLLNIMRSQWGQSPKWNADAASKSLKGATFAQLDKFLDEEFDWDDPDIWDDDDTDILHYH